MKWAFILYNIIKHICLCLSLKVVFHATRANSRWWYVIQTAPRSRHIFQEGGVEEEMPHSAILTEAINETSMETEESSSASLEEASSSTYDTSNKGDDESLDDDFSDNDRLLFQETTNGYEEDTISTSLGINLEVVLEISHEDMLLDEISMLDV